VSRPRGSAPGRRPWERVAPLLTPDRRAELDSLLAVDPVLGRTRLAWLEAGPVSATPAAVKDELEKLAFLRGMDAHTIDLSVLPAERRRFLAGVGRRLTPQHLARRDDGRRYPVLLTLVTQSAVDVLDEVLLLFDQALTGREAAAKSKMTEALAERARNRRDLAGKPQRARRHPGQPDRPARHRARHRHPRRDPGELRAVRPRRPPVLSPDPRPGQDHPVPAREPTSPPGTRRPGTSLPAASTRT
jgi:hypothetical protein